MFRFCASLFLFIYLISDKFFSSVSSIKCQRYNETCGPENECTTTEECAGEHNHCFVLWSNGMNSTGNTPVVKLKGCILSSGGECDGQERCVEKGTRRNAELLFCCCKLDACNANFIWDVIPAPPSTNENPHKLNESMTVIAYIILLPLTSCFLVMSIMFLPKQPKMAFQEVPLLDQPASGPPHISEKHRPIELHQVVAQGKYGTVRKAMNLDTKEVVAVKIISVQEKQSWLTEKEVYQIPLMEHENILRFIGAEKHSDSLHTSLWLITQYHEFGSLQDFLKENVVTWEQLCKISYTMVRGLSHLHEEIPSEHADMYKLAVAHRDFKSSNVLLKNDLTACIADFGLALIFKPTQSCGDTHRQVGTRRYMAPEVLEGAINFSRNAFLQIDMYACGLVLWEIASRCSIQCPVPNYKLPFEAEVGPHPSLEDVQEAVVHKKLRPVIDDSWKEYPGFRTLLNTIDDCWDHDAEARLSALCVMERFASLM